MTARVLSLLAAVAALAIILPTAALAQPACPAPTIVSAADVPCTITFSFVNNDTDPPKEISSVDVAPGDKVQTEEPRGANGIAVQTAGGLVTIAPGETLKNVKIDRDCCVDIEFDWWTCTIYITKSAGPC